MLLQQPTLKVSFSFTEMKRYALLDVFHFRRSHLELSGLRPVDNTVGIPETLRPTISHKREDRSSAIYSCGLKRRAVVCPLNQTVRKLHKYSSDQLNAESAQAL